MLNRPSETAVAEAVPDLVPLVGDEERVYVGGPVQQSAVLVLAEFDDPDDAARARRRRRRLRPRATATSTLLAAATRQRARVRRLRRLGPRPARGRARGGVVDRRGAGPGVDLFPEPETDLWGSVLRGKGGMYRVVALMPEDPSQN